MIATFTALLLAHVVADFVLQTKWLVARKRHPGVLLAHGAIVLLTAQAATGRWDAPELIALALAHVAIDAVKTYGGFDGVLGFLGDQLAHLATLGAAALLAPGLWESGLWASLGGAAWPLHAYALIAGGLLATRAGGFAVGHLMAPYGAVSLPEGLKNGGALIGLLERGLIYLFLIAGQPMGIGFLIAAKSILRFDATANNHKAGEYVIIGTLASFGWALLVSYAIVSLRMLLPPLEVAAANP